MRWKGRRESDNVEDRRGVRAGGAVAGGGIGVILLALLVMVLGGDPSALLGGTAPSDGPAVERRASAEENELASFVKVVLADTEDVWHKVFREELGRSYREPKLVLFTDQVQSACGTAGREICPFYCSGDETIYIDLSFYEELKRRFGAPGDFAQAYVIAHEVGHHVQHLLGTMDQVNRARATASKSRANDLSVRLELQADYYAGLWAHHAQRMKSILDREDLEEALNAAHQIGDDVLQKEAQGYVVPDSFTHGTGEQRMRWFNAGWESGRLRDGDTLRATRL